MPLDDASLLGTERNGMKSHIYCKYCYLDGAFTSPHMTLEGMRSHLKGLMRPSGMTDKQMNEHLAGLAHLQRWLGGKEDASRQ